MSTGPQCRMPASSRAGSLQLLLARHGTQAFDPRIRRVQSIMYWRLGRKLRLEGLAREMGISVSRLAHLFKNQIGVAPAQHLKSIRLQRAKDLLEGTRLSVKEVAAQVGMNPSALIKEFRRAYGHTPGEHRRTSRTRHESVVAGFERAAGSAAGMTYE